MPIYSVLTWNIPAVVAEEKLIRFTSMESFFRVSKYIRAVVVFAVPLPPTISTGCRCFCMSRYESTVQCGDKVKYYFPPDQHT